MSDDLVVYDRTTFRAMWPLEDSDGVPLVTAGWTASAQIRASAESATILETFTVTLSTGFVELLLAATPRSWGSGVYDVKLTSPTAEVTRPISGYIWCRLSVTR
jgi:hypothetical protein